MTGSRWTFGAAHRSQSQSQTPFFASVYSSRTFDRTSHLLLSVCVGQLHCTGHQLCSISCAYVCVRLVLCRCMVPVLSEKLNRLKIQCVTVWSVCVIGGVVVVVVEVGKNRIKDGRPVDIFVNDVCEE